MKAWQSIEKEDGAFREAVKRASELVKMTSEVVG